jgi:hypothetical protein
MEARIDLTGNGYNLTGATPSWSSGAGWTSYAGFSSFASVLSNGDSFVWCGKLAYASTHNFFGNASNNYTGIVGFANPSGDKIICGYNASDAAAIEYVGYVSGDLVCIAYTKDGSNSEEQKLYIDGALEVTQAGSEPTDNSFQLYTGGECVGAAIYSGILSLADVGTLSTYLLGL